MSAANQAMPQDSPRGLHRGISRMMHWLAPAECLLCKTPHDAMHAICADCEAGLSLNTQCCHRCALPYAERDSVITHGLKDARHPSTTTHPRSYTLLHFPDALCGGCRHAPPHFETTRAPYLMRTGIRDLIHQWKFQNRPHLSTLLALLFREATSVGAHWPTPWRSSTTPAVLVPIPTQWRRQVQRGFDHTWVLAHALKSQYYRSLVVRSWLRNRRHRRAQHQLDRAARWQDAEDRFTADPKLAGCCVILVDDVMTTGATARAAAQVCCEAGAQSVEVWCLARTPTVITTR